MEYLGKIEVANASAVNNLTTATPFNIPRSSRVVLQSDTGGVLFELGAAAGFQTTAARGAVLPAADIPSDPIDTGGVSTGMPYALGTCVPAGVTGANQGGAGVAAPATPTPVLSIRNDTGGAAVVQVYAVPRS